MLADTEEPKSLRPFLEAVKESVQRAGTELLGLSPEEQNDVRDALLRGEPLYRILGMKKSLIEARYALAHQLYAAGKYEDAETLFLWLTTYAGDTETYWMGLGACRQARENYDGALEAYQVAALDSSLQDPAPFYYSGICLLRQGRREDAIVSLKAVLTLADTTNAEHAGFVGRAQSVLAGMETGA